MKALISLGLILICLTLAQTNKVYKVDISESPQQYWNRIFHDGDNFNTIKGFVAAVNKNLTHLITDEIVNYLEGDFKTTYYDQEFIENLEATASILKLPLADIAIFNFIYEYFAGCTSLIAQDENGHIIHGRNLDYIFKEFTVPLASQIEFYDKDKPLYTISYLLGLVGGTAGMKNQEFALSIDQRTRIDGKYFIDNFVKIMKQKKSNVPFFITKCIERATSFQNALQILATSELDQNAYFILSGVQSNEGVVIERSPTSIHGIYGISIEKGQWFIVQTNYDRDIPDPKTDPRRTAAEDKLKILGQKEINEKNIRDNILAQPPNKNTLTILSIIMSAQTNYFKQKVYIETTDESLPIFDFPFPSPEELLEFEQ